MKFNQQKYINSYNKDKYKIYQFRVKKEYNDLIQKLDNEVNRNKFIIDLLNNQYFSNILTIKQIKSLILPVLKKYNINNVYLFGSYARGEANCESDIDIYCEKGNIKTLIDEEKLIEELNHKTNKKIDIIFTTTQLNSYFKKQIMEDMIKIC